MSDIIDDIYGNPLTKFMGKFFRIEAHHLTESGHISEGNEVHTGVALKYLMGFFSEDQARKKDISFRSSTNLFPEIIFRIMDKFYLKLNEAMGQEIKDGLENIRTSYPISTGNGARHYSKYNEAAKNFEKFGNGLYNKFIEMGNEEFYKIELIYPPQDVDPLPKSKEILFYRKNNKFYFIADGIKDVIEITEKNDRALFESIKKRFQDYDGDISEEKVTEDKQQIPDRKNILNDDELESIITINSRLVCGALSPINLQENGIKDFIANKFPKISHLTYQQIITEEGLQSISPLQSRTILRVIGNTGTTKLGNAAITFNKILDSLPPPEEQIALLPLGLTVGKKELSEDMPLAELIIAGASYERIEYLKNQGKNLVIKVPEDSNNQEQQIEVAVFNCAIARALAYRIDGSDIYDLLKETIPKDTQKNIDENIKFKGKLLVHALINNNEKLFDKVLDNIDSPQSYMEIVEPHDLSALQIAARMNSPFINKLLEKISQIPTEVDRNNILNQENPLSNKTALMIAAAHGYTEASRVLIEKGAAPNKANAAGWTALMFAAENGHAKAIRVLIEKGADLNKVDKDEWTPLMIAAKKGHAEAIRVLMEKGADPNQVNKDDMTSLFIAAAKGYAEAIRALIEGYAGRKSDPNQANKDGMTPLIYAATRGHVEAINVLIEKGAGLNKADKEEWTPLMFAAQNGHAEAIRVLIEKGADLNKANKHGWTPLMIAAKNGHAEVIRALIEGYADRKADPNQVYKDGWTPLMIAANNGHTDAIKVLIAGGANPNKADKDGWAPLMFAAQKGYVEAIKALIEGYADRKADPNQAKTNGATPLIIAAEKGHAKAIRVLIERGADPNKSKAGGWTALMIAAKNGHSDAVKALIEIPGIEFSSRIDISNLISESKKLVTELHKIIDKQFPGIISIGVKYDEACQAYPVIGPSPGSHQIFNSIMSGKVSSCPFARCLRSFDKEKVESINPRIIIKKPFDQVLSDLKDKDCKKPSMVDIIEQPVPSMKHLPTDSKQLSLQGQPPIMDLSGMPPSLLANANTQQVLPQRGIEVKLF